ncbi:MAG: flavin reductase [Chloroflexi bacterium]|nr:MAG: flavin reductase [Chloroflexota bacterium]
MSVDPLVFRSAMARLATGVTILTTRRGDRHEVMTANAVTSVSLHPTLVLASISSESTWLQAVRCCGRFAVNVLAAHHEDLARWCADHARHEQPEAITRHDVSVSPESGLLLFNDALVTAECRAHAEHLAGDHVLVLGEVIAIDVRDACAEPLVFFDRGYGRVVS